ncbi:MAG: ABC transporter ATP-binding protein [Candidatus Dormibacteraeota bacterium]|nr:ABC transporter ATP-binding protein [Candidatus Dormibacteraeota bacterium]MBV9526164.1 ABC transporter ATP-binding protein [Candidatus Dormibacteraeota bacterium]
MTGSGEVAIRAEGLTKDYGSGRGLFGLDLVVHRGETFGYLGPNGAGKSTTIRLLMGMIQATRGRASIFGLDCRRDAVEVKRHVGYVPGDVPQFGGLRGSEVVSYVGAMRGGVDSARVRELCEAFDLDLHRKFREYSRGNKQKLALVLALMNRPELLILDEPTSGLDPLNQQTFQELVRQATRDGATAFLSSHVLSEVEHICTRVGIIREGHLVGDRTLEELHELRFHTVEAEFTGPVPEEAVRSAAGVGDVRVEGSRLTCTVHGEFAPLLDALRQGHAVNLVSTEPSLESIFLAYYRGTQPDDAATSATT